MLSHYDLPCNIHYGVTIHERTYVAEAYEANSGGSNTIYKVVKPYNKESMDAEISAAHKEMFSHLEELGYSYTGVSNIMSLK